MYYTYCHQTADTGKIFYIGKGIDRRYKRSVSRNPYWHNIVNKYGFNAKILAYWDTEKEALDHEKLLISCFKDMGYKLANLTNGGESGSGYVMPESEKLKRRNFKHTIETKEKISKSSKNFWKNLPVIDRSYITEEYKSKKRKISLKIGSKPPIHFGKNHPMAKKIKCIETKQIFNTLIDAKKWINEHNFSRMKIKSLDTHSLIKACKNKKMTYKHHWEYV